MKRNEIREHLKIESVIEKIKYKQLKWFTHLMRMPRNFAPGKGIHLNVKFQDTERTFMEALD